jgi:23S rRNA (pseudouridine1915-N3)-methyltransferase
MKHEILLLGKTKDHHLQHCIDDYAGRLHHYTNFSISFLNEKKHKRTIKNQDKKLQGELLLEAAYGTFKVVLDVRGRQFSSEGLAEKIQAWELHGIKHVTYLLGGPEGLSAEVLNSADLKLSISKMTFTHDMVRLLIVEQLYRAYTIKAGEKYHK